MVAPEVVDGVDQAGELALARQLLVKPGARQPVGRMVILQRAPIVTESYLSKS